MGVITGTHYPIITYEKSHEIVVSLLEKNAPKLTGKELVYIEPNVWELDSDWLQGQKPTIALINARRAEIADWRIKLKAAIVVTQEELAVYGEPATQTVEVSSPIPQE